MPRQFNLAGPCKPDIHYMLPPERRFPGVRSVIEGQHYFVVHAPRQSGKTTALMAFARELTASGKYTSVLVSMEQGQPFLHDLEALEPAFLDGWRWSCLAHLPTGLQPPEWPPREAGARVRAALSAWAKASSRPLVLFLDEIDALQDDALITVLRQIRAGFPDRPKGFPWSLGLVGLRDVRDYKVAGGGTPQLGTSSPFNIKVGSFTLENFTRDDVAELYGQHTEETGQVFETKAIDQAWELSRGQPWLVNALARECVMVLSARGEPVTSDDMDAAARTLIVRMDTHLDSLAERLREPRVQAVIEPIVAGRGPDNVPDDDVRYALDLGLIRRGSEGGVVISNPIYSAIIPRMLGYVTRHGLPQIPAVWLRPDGSLDEAKLLDAFLAFWRRHGESMLASAPYAEVAAQLVLLAFFDRVANGGGLVLPEYALGRRRMDVCLHWKRQRMGLELKVWRDGRPDPEAEGLEQLDGYLAALGLDTGWLVIFDQRSGLVPIEARTSSSVSVTPAGRHVAVVRA